MRSADRRDATKRALLSAALGVAAVVAGATPWVGRAKPTKTAAATPPAPRLIALK